MSFDRDALADAITEHEAVARIVVADVKGSTPREVGASMLVWADGQSGTIGGGTLEFEAMRHARAALSRSADSLDQLPLGPAMGQCCGGHVTLLTEVWDDDRLAIATGDVIARATPGAAKDPVPMAVRYAISKARSGGAPISPGLLQGWMIEPATRATRPIWIYGAGHVGRALVGVLSALPEVAITWVDTGPERFPDKIPDGVTRLVAANPADVVIHAPAEAEHLILTYSHALDLELCHRLLGRSFRSVGLIGSKTKWARFRSRLRQLGHDSAQIDRITCPIGDPALGKHPQAIAVSVAHGLLLQSETTTRTKTGAA